MLWDQVDTLDTLVLSHLFFFLYYIHCEGIVHTHYVDQCLNELILDAIILGVWCQLCLHLIRQGSLLVLSTLSSPTSTRTSKERQYYMLMLVGCLVMPNLLVFLKSLWKCAFKNFVPPNMRTMGIVSWNIIQFDFLVIFVCLNCCSNFLLSVLGNWFLIYAVFSVVSYILTM